MVENKDAWTFSNVRAKDGGRLRHFPSEYLLRSIFSKRYFNLQTETNKEWRVLDIGCLYANNLVPFFDRRAKLHGIEVNEEMAAISRQCANEWGIGVDIRIGTNREIPYPDGYFDFVLSINTLHYEANEVDVVAGLREFRRVGKSGCQYLIVTNGNENDFHKSAVRRGVNQYQLRTREFRNGQIMGYFDSIEHFARTLSREFSKVETATILERYPRETVHFFVAKCQK